MCSQECGEGGGRLKERGEDGEAIKVRRNDTNLVVEEEKGKSPKELKKDQLQRCNESFGGVMDSSP